MKKDIEILKSKYGDNKKVARLLGITPRHLRGIKSGKNKAGKPLKKLIDGFILKIQELEKLSNPANDNPGHQPENGQGENADK